MGGVIVDSASSPGRKTPRVTGLNQPEASYHGVVYTEAFGPATYIGRARTVPCATPGLRCQHKRVSVAAGY